MSLVIAKAQNAVAVPDAEAAPSSEASNEIAEPAKAPAKSVYTYVQLMLENVFPRFFKKSTPLLPLLGTPEVQACGTKCFR